MNHRIHNINKTIQGRELTHTQYLKTNQGREQGHTQYLQSYAGERTNTYTILKKGIRG